MEWYWYGKNNNLRIELGGKDPDNITIQSEDGGGRVVSTVVLTHAVFTDIKKDGDKETPTLDYDGIAKRQARGHLFVFQDFCRGESFIDGKAGTREASARSCGDDLDVQSRLYRLFFQRLCKSAF